MGDSRKKDRKYTSDYFVIYDNDSGDPLGRLRNLTEEGAMIISPDPISVPTVINCKLRLPDIIEGCREISFEMESRWCQYNKRAYWYEVGFRFIDLPDHCRDIIEHLAAEWMRRDPNTVPRLSN